MAQYIKMLLPFFLLSLTIRNVWPKRMGVKAFIGLYVLILLAGMPVTLLSDIPYGLFGIPAAVCIYGFVVCRDNAAQNVCMGMIGFVLAVVTDNLLANVRNLLIYILLFYFITLLCGRLIRKLFLSGKGVLRLRQTWYLIDAVLLLLMTIYLFDDLISGQNDSVGRIVYNNILHISGYLLVLLFLLLAMRCFCLEEIQIEAKQKALQDLQDYTQSGSHV